MPRDRINPPLQSALNRARANSLEAFKRFEAGMTDGRLPCEVDAEGNFTFEIVAKLRGGSAFSCPVTLPGKSRLTHFADVKDGLNGDERIFVTSEASGKAKRFYSHLPGFAFSGSFTDINELGLFASMLRHPRQKDVDLVGEDHPAYALNYNLAYDVPEDEIEAFDPDDKLHVSEQELLERVISARWACWNGTVLSACSEPYYTVLAPENVDDVVEITSSVEQNFYNTAFATFAADRKKEADHFASMLVELGCAAGIRPGCEIILHAPNHVSPRNHGTEIAYISWALADTGYDRTELKQFADFSETARRAGYFPHWSDGRYWVDPYDEWEARNEWASRWKHVSNNLGPITRATIDECPSEGIRARLRLKPLLDYLTFGSSSQAA